MSNKTKIAVDIMGGDHAPDEIIEGSLEAAGKLDVEIILVGTREAFQGEIEKARKEGLPVTTAEATQVIKDGEDPAFGVMRKPQSSIPMAAGMVKSGQADAMVSAGSTGAVMVSALQYVGTLPGIDRPMVGGAFLQLAPETIVIDLGANIGVQPYHLVDFAVTGSVYARTFMGISDPTIGLLNVGSEKGKGNDLAKEAYGLLEKSGLNFRGNVEGMDIPFSRANVIVCDGFTGNILVKFCEGLGRVVKEWLEKELEGRLGASEIGTLSEKLYRLLSPGTAMGGGPLWGVNGVVAVAHGSSRAPQIVETIKQAKKAVDSGFVKILGEELKKARESLKSGPDNS